ncbi:transcription antitermination factor NusB [candidate division NPL-UPA2 bacterium]|nr:transcription antitermination factor NusB [candidate division NPL-UPA2 bacterium]
MGKRRKARELALQILYGMEISKGELPWILSDFWEEHPCPEEVGNFATELVTGTYENLSSIDNLLKKYTNNWDISRLAAVDRNILRLATYELLFLDGIPSRVTINEAIEIAKKYSTADSGKFVNGILDRIKNEKR